MQESTGHLSRIDAPENSGPLIEIDMRECAGTLCEIDMQKCAGPLSEICRYAGVCWTLSRINMQEWA
jgi:hypothetical protein